MRLGKQNDKTAFEVIFKRNYRKLCILAFQIIKDTEEAKDIVNDVFEFTWKNFDGLREDTIDAYLYTSVRNRSLNQLERGRMKNSISDADLEAWAALEPTGEEPDDLIDQIYAVCERLPDKTRHVLNQCYFHHKKYKEVAEEMGITSDAVKKHIMKALKILRDSVKKREDV